MAWGVTWFSGGGNGSGEGVISFWDTYALMVAGVTSPVLDGLYGVRTTTGVYPFRKKKGLWRYDGAVFEWFSEGTQHAIGGDQHQPDTLANLNTKLSDATLSIPLGIDGQLGANNGAGVWKTTPVFYDSVNGELVLLDLTLSLYNASSTEKWNIGLDAGGNLVFTAIEGSSNDSVTFDMQNATAGQAQIKVVAASGEQIRYSYYHASSLKYYMFMQTTGTSFGFKDVLNNVSVWEVDSNGSLRMPSAVKFTGTNNATDHYTILDNDLYTNIDMTTGGVNRTVLFPTLTANQGRLLIISKVDAGVGVVNIALEGAEKFLDGTATRSLSNQGDVIYIVGSLTGWKIISSTPTPNLFGTEYQVESSLALSTTTSITPVTKATLTTPTIPAGQYDIFVKFEWNRDIASNDFLSQLLVDGVSVMEHNQESKDLTSWQTVSSSRFDHTLTNAVHTIVLNYWGETGSNTSSIRNAQIKIVRVS